MLAAQRVLAARVAQLDASRTAADSDLGVDPDLVRFVRSMALVTPTAHALGRLPAEEADAIIEGSTLLRRLRGKAPALIDGGIVGHVQCWIATQRPPHLPRRSDALDPQYFIEAREGVIAPLRTKPFDLGLFTSTYALGTYGMWWCYLRIHEGSTLFRTPWKAWRLEIDRHARILEITSASDWVRFVVSVGTECDGLLYPDWLLAGRNWDGVHMTAPAVAATQGLQFIARHADHAITAAPYWDVESTLWLHWVFRDAQPGDIRNE